jgi:hypothetical protein
METPVRRISDVAPTRNELEGTHFKLRDLVNREFIIREIAEYHGSDGNYMAVNVVVDGEVGFFFSSHQVVAQQLKECQGQTPLLAEVKMRTSSSGSEYFVLE